MNFPQHLLRLIIGPEPRVTESVHVLTRDDVQWGTPVFRAPALPTPHQFSSELPFTTTLGPRLPRHR